MSVFEFVTGVFLGIAAAVTLAAIARWRSIGFSGVVALGLVGGGIGAVIGAASTASGPLWGDMGYHPFSGLFAFLGGASAVTLVRLLIGRSTRTAPAIRGDHPSR